MDKDIQYHRAIRHLAYLWEKEPGQAIHAYTLYSLADRVESLSPGASERELHQVVEQARRDGLRDAFRWTEEGEALEAELELTGFQEWLEEDPEKHGAILLRSIFRIAPKGKEEEDETSDDLLELREKSDMR